ncbi:MAG: hypothetical protein M1541_20950, partial [Acidobacteria bacterium]|nr:hypothetical protein [Acidobacteriota bacterium]
AFGPPVERQRTNRWRSCSIDASNCWKRGWVRSGAHAGLSSMPPNLSGGGTPTRWFNTGAFQAPAAYTFGNAGRGILRGPRQVFFDSSIHKNFNWRERVNVQVRGDFLNFFNHSNLGRPNDVMGSPSFGVTNPSGSRVVQLGLRIFF